MLYPKFTAWCSAERIGAVAGKHTFNARIDRIYPPGQERHRPVAINGTTVATATGQTVALPAGAYIALTYSSEPTWVWSALPAQPAGIGPEVSLVAGSAPAGGQAGTLPQTTFLAGQAIVLDPAGALYAAIGAGT